MSTRLRANAQGGPRQEHRSFLWSSRTAVWDDIAAVVFDFAKSRARLDARRFLGVGEDGMSGWRATFICNDYADSCSSPEFGHALRSWKSSKSG